LWFLFESLDDSRNPSHPKQKFPRWQKKAVSLVDFSYKYASIFDRANLRYNLIVAVPDSQQLTVLYGHPPPPIFSSVLFYPIPIGPEFWMPTSVHNCHLRGSQNLRVLLEFRMIREVLQPFSRYLPGSIPIPALELDVCCFDEFLWRAVRHIDLPFNL